MAELAVGRDSERDILLSRLAALRQGEGSLAVVEGEGGTGKSTLVAGLLATARDEQCHVLHARAWELSSSVPYETLVAAVSRHLRSRPADEVARLTAGLSTLGAVIEGLDLAPPTGAPETFKVRAQDAVATLVARIGSERPVVLAVDDLHWADQASIEVLQYLSLDLPDAPLLVVVTVRPDEAERRPELRQLLAGLRRAPWSTTVTLGRLDRSAIAAIVDARLGGPVTPRIYELVAERSGGTPLLVHELLDDLVERGVIGTDAGVWRLHGSPPAVTRSAGDLIRARLDRVEAHDRAVLEALAVINAPTDAALVAAVLALARDDVERSLERLRGNRLAVEGDYEPGRAAAWTVEHPVIAEVVEAELVDAARRRLHRRVLEVDHEAPIGRRARHALLAGDPTDRLATVALLADAGAAALARATPSAGIEPLRGALDLLGPDDDAGLRHSIERDLGTCYLRQLEIEPALTLLRGAWERARSRDDARACVELVHVLDNAEFRAGNGGVSAASLDWLRATAAAQGALDLLVELGWVHLSHAGRDRSSTELDRYAAAIELIPEDSLPRRGEALREIGDAYRQMGSTAVPSGDRVEVFLAASERWSELPAVAERWALMALDSAMLSGDRALMARCDAALRRLQQLTGEPVNWRVPWFTALYGIAEGRLDERLGDLRVFGARVRSNVLDASVTALARRFVGGPDVALAEFERDLPRGENEGGRASDLQRVFGRLVVGLGTAREPELAAAAIRGIGEDEVLADVGGFPFGGASWLARALAGDADGSGEAIADLDRLGAGRWLPSAWAHTLRARASDSRAGAAAELLHAADVLAGLGRTLEEAERVVDAAEADPASVDPARLEAAYGAARRAGALWLSARIEALTPAGRSRNWARSSDSALTARELEVAELVAEGLTNREIASRLYISIRTVTSHLDHIYTKLGLSSREALTAWQHARD